jgi:hypothetical protein
LLPTSWIDRVRQHDTNEIYPAFPGQL